MSTGNAFQSFVCIGTQRGMLMMSLAPLLSTGLAWVIFWRQSDLSLSPGRTFQGVLFGLGAASGQAVGYVLSKQGLAGGFPPIAGNSIRMLAAVVVLWALAELQGKTRATLHSMRERPKVLGWLTLTAFTGPVLGATFSLIALQYTRVGISSTLIALPPVFLLPVSWVVFKEKFDWGAVLGTFSHIT